MQEIEPPIALRRPFAQRHADARGVVGRHFTGLEDLLFGPLDLLVGYPALADLLDRVQDEILHFLGRAAARHFGVHAHQTGIVLGAGIRRRAGGFLGFH